MKIRFVLTVLVLSLARCTTSTAPVHVGSCAPEDTRAIAAALYATSGWPPTPVFGTSVPLGPYTRSLRSLDAKDLPPDLLRDLLDRNQVSSTVTSGSPESFPVSRTPSDPARRVLRVSLPGYSRDGGLAAVYLGSACGPVCGEAVVVVLHRAGEEWKLLHLLPLKSRGSA